MRIKFILIVIVLLVVLLGLAYGFNGSSDYSQTIEQKYISVCSFNIKFLGHYHRTESLSVLKDYIQSADCDVLLIQELVSDAKGICHMAAEDAHKAEDDHKVDKEVADFIISMMSIGYKCSISPDKTGHPKNLICNQANSCESYGVFYRQDKVQISEKMPGIFLEDDLVGNANYDRVPYAFSLRSEGRELDFVLIAVHLHEKYDPSDKPQINDEKKRTDELKSITKWIQSRTGNEDDYAIVGDMNFESADELCQADMAINGTTSCDMLDSQLINLNTEGAATNLGETQSPFDDAIVSSSFAKHVDSTFDFNVSDLRLYVERNAPYLLPKCLKNPEHFNATEFGACFSDHNLIKFRLIIPDKDDD